MSQADRKTRQIIEAYFGDSVDDEVYAALKPVQLRGGEWLFRQGDVGDALYFLVRGRLQAWAEGGAGNGEPRLLGEVLPGDSVGEAGLLSAAPRSAGIRANRDSLLMRLEKPVFDRLASQHPALVMKLAGHVANLMQRNLNGSASAQRGFNTITLVALHPGALVATVVDEVAEGLAAMAGTRRLQPDGLQAAGAPQGLSASAGELPEGLKQWLSDQESEFPMVVYCCQGQDDAWARFAIRQADMVVYFADATETPALTGAEQSLGDAGIRPAGKRALVLVHSSAQISGTAGWLQQRDVNFHVHIRPDRKRDVQRLLRLLSGNAVGLVLGAGAVRGLAELGVYKAMVEAGVPVDWVGGSSIGSIVGAAIAHDWPPEHAIKVARDAFVGGKPFSDYTLPIVSLIRGQRMVRLLRAAVDVNIEDLPLPFFCVSSKLDKGEVHVHRLGSVVEALRASAALPGVLPPAVVDSELAVDGAVLNNLPVDIMRLQAVSKIIAVDVSCRDHRRVDYSETPTSWAILRGRLLPFAKRYRVPSLATLILRSTEIGTLLQSRERGKLADLLINPPVRQFKLTDVRAYDQIVEAGYQQARSDLAEWLEGGGWSGGEQGPAAPPPGS
jgi:predicted acylesterase/phospholipase RssA/CRP-like cAMP-binding protein